jgi:O-antigen/teichoic acid export membrane protein
MNPIRQLFGQTAIYGLGTVLPRLLNYLLLTPFFTRIFLLGEYGIITELYAYVVFLMIILTYGMETGFFRFASEKHDWKRIYSTTLLSVFVTSGVFVVCVYIFSKSIAYGLDYSTHPEYIRWIALIVSIDAFTAIPFARLRLKERALKFAIIKILSVVLNIFLNFIFLWFIPNHYERWDWDIIGLIYNKNIGVGYVFISNLIASIFTLIMLTGEIINVKILFDRLLWLKMINYSFPVLLSGLAGTVNEALDRILLKHLLTGELNPLEQLGIYGANYKIAVLMTLFVQMFRYASEPFYFSRYKETGSLKLFADIMKYFVISGLIIYMVVILYLDIFKYFIGSGFHEGLKIVPVIMLANLMLGVFFNLSIWYKLINLTWYGALLTGIGALITLLINWMFVPHYGYIASAWAHLICYTTMVIISYYLGIRYLRINYDVRRILLYIIICVVLVQASRTILIENQIVKMTLNTAIIAIFLGIILYKERRNIRSTKE